MKRSEAVKLLEEESYELSLTVEANMAREARDRHLVWRVGGRYLLAWTEDDARRQEGRQWDLGRVNALEEIARCIATGGWEDE